MKTTRLSSSPCPACGRMLDSASCVTDNVGPSPGDITICIRCGHIMAFDDDMTLRNLTDQEMYEVAGDQTIIAVQKARQKVVK